MGKKTDRQLILDAACSWLDELGGDISKYASPEERKDYDKQSKQLQKAIAREQARAKQKAEEAPESSPTLAIDGITVTVYRSALEFDKGQPVVQVDGTGVVRVNMNDGAIWNADPDDHDHEDCKCVKAFEDREEP